MKYSSYIFFIISLISLSLYSMDPMNQEQIQIRLEDLPEEIQILAHIGDIEGAAQELAQKFAATQIARLFEAKKDDIQKIKSDLNNNCDDALKTFQEKIRNRTVEESDFTIAALQECLPKFRLIAMHANFTNDMEAAKYFEYFQEVETFLDKIAKAAAQMNEMESPHH